MPRILRSNSGKGAFGDAFVIWVSELDQDRRDFLIDIFQESIAWIYAVVEPLKHHVEVFLGWRLDYVLLQTIFHLHLEVVGRQVIQEILPDPHLVCAVFQRPWISGHTCRGWSLLEETLVAHGRII